MRIQRIQNLSMHKWYTEAPGIAGGNKMEIVGKDIIWVVPTSGDGHAAVWLRGRRRFVQIRIRMLRWQRLISEPSLSSSPRDSRRTSCAATCRGRCRIS